MSGLDTKLFVAHYNADGKFSSLGLPEYKLGDYRSRVIDDFMSKSTQIHEPEIDFDKLHEELLERAQELLGNDSYMESPELRFIWAYLDRRRRGFYVINTRSTHLEDWDEELKRDRHPFTLYDRKSALNLSTRLGKLQLAYNRSLVSANHYSFQGNRDYAFDYSFAVPPEIQSIKIRKMLDSRSRDWLKINELVSPKVAVEVHSLGINKDAL